MQRLFRLGLEGEGCEMAGNVIPPAGPAHRHHAGHVFGAIILRIKFGCLGKPLRPVEAGGDGIAAFAPIEPLHDLIGNMIERIGIEREDAGNLALVVNRSAVHGQQMRGLHGDHGAKRIGPFVDMAQHPFAVPGIWQKALVIIRREDRAA